MKTLLLALGLSLAAFADSTGPRIHLIGDSTMADKPLIGNPERGWGQMFRMLVDDPGRVRNHARNGRSTKSFIDEGRWNAVLDELKPGDFVLIQFGHNDAKREDPKRFADARTEYQTNLMRFISEARMKLAIPVLLTPVCRRQFDTEGTLIDVHGDYPAVVREVGNALSVPVLDLHQRTFELFQQLGDERTRQYFLWVDSGKYSALPNGKKDNTHFTAFGARELALIAAEESRKSKISLAGFLNLNGHEGLIGAGKLVMLDCYYNNERRTAGKGLTERYHYVWQDTTNSGFSKLGLMISDIGAVIDTLCRKPTVSELKRADIYIIVDPDTPEETDSPHFLDTEAINDIETWVRGGGILVLMGNDSGRSEFEHFNRLAERFGMQFNEDSRNPATSEEFDKATFTSFADHPLFKNLRRIFLKEICTLRIDESAEAIFTDKGDVIMATANVGKGIVFAVGDPWFYNEYMGTWRLPDGYDNPQAARNLFLWPLEETTK